MFLSGRLVSIRLTCVSNGLAVAPTLGRTLNPQIAPAGVGTGSWSGFREELPSSRPHGDGRKVSQRTSSFCQ